MAAYKCGKSDHICYSWGKEIRYDFHGVVYCYMLCCVVLDGRCKSDRYECWIRNLVIVIRSIRCVNVYFFDRHISTKI